MRHQKTIKKLGRTHAHRKATLAALSTALIRHHRITTTLPKAKALRVYVEPILTRSKEDTTANRRQVFRHLQDKEAIKELFGAVASAIGDRPGGYTRIVKLGQRPGDGTEMAVIELVDFNTTGEQTGAKKGSRRRTRRSTGKAKKTDEGGDQPQAEKAEKAPKAEKTPKTTPDTPVAQDVTPETASDVNAQAPGTPLDAPEPTEGGAAQNPEAGIPGEGGQNQFR
jgi:large subunit ribosomal protein L17